MTTETALSIISKFTLMILRVMNSTYPIKARMKRRPFPYGSVPVLPSDSQKGGAHSKPRSMDITVKTGIDVVGPVPSLMEGK